MFLKHCKSLNLLFAEIPWVNRLPNPRRSSCVCSAHVQPRLVASPELRGSSNSEMSYGMCSKGGHLPPSSQPRDFAAMLWGVTCRYIGNHLLSPSQEHNICTYLSLLHMEVGGLWKSVIFGSLMLV